MFNIGPQEMFVGFLVMSFVGLLVLFPWYKIVTKAGFSGWWCLLFVVPGVNLLGVFYLALAEWPVLRRSQEPPSP